MHKPDTINTYIKSYVSLPFKEMVSVTATVATSNKCYP